jgi:hypothetical protein
LGRRTPRLGGVPRLLRPLDGNAKARLFAWACGLMRKSAEDKAAGRHYGKVSAKGREVLHALLWKFHNAVTGLCFPSYEAIIAHPKPVRLLGFFHFLA